MELIVTPRTILGKKVKQLRKQSIIPAVLYGKGQENIFVSFDKNTFLKAYREVGKSMPLDIKSEDGKIDEMVIVQDVYVHPVTDVLEHVDFHIIHKGEKVHAEIQLKFEGTAPAEKAKLGRLQFVKDTISIVALPKDLIKEVTVDVSTIETAQDLIFVKDINVPANIEVQDDPSLAVVILDEFGGGSSDDEEATEDAAPTEGATEEAKSE